MPVHGECLLIKRFSVLYVGQIDLDDVGANGRDPDQRRYSNDVLIRAKVIPAFNGRG
ncbi:MAG: hypothetical protein IIB89_12345 [Chloroflexi bacterium]|nr:hypothetical protein [Chloroflexota bacterium]